MSRKVKRHAQSSAKVKRQAGEERMAEEKERSRGRMEPTARKLLLGDVVFLAVCQLLERGGAISGWLSGVTVLIGVVLLAAALWFQFGPGGDRRL